MKIRGSEDNDYLGIEISYATIRNTRYLYTDENDIIWWECWLDQCVENDGSVCTDNDVLDMYQEWKGWDPMMVF